MYLHQKAICICMVLLKLYSFQHLNVNLHTLISLSLSFHSRATTKKNRVALVALYLCIWGEAANVRFLPEGICYIYHQVSFLGFLILSSWLCWSFFLCSFKDCDEMLLRRPSTSSLLNEHCSFSPLIVYVPQFTICMRLILLQNNHFRKIRRVLYTDLSIDSSQMCP